jgi:hypothetical protein
MELKDMIMSTLAELEEVGETNIEEDKLVIQKKSNIAEEPLPDDKVEQLSSSERQFYENIRERILVLFEGFQSPNNKNIEAKVDLTLNFLEYLLASLDDRLENLK